MEAQEFSFQNQKLGGDCKPNMFSPSCSNQEEHKKDMSCLEELLESSEKLPDIQFNFLDMDLLSSLDGVSVNSTPSLVPQHSTPILQLLEMEVPVMMDTETAAEGFDIASSNGSSNSPATTALSEGSSTISEDQLLNDFLRDVNFGDCSEDPFSPSALSLVMRSSPTSHYGEIQSSDSEEGEAQCKGSRKRRKTTAQPKSHDDDEEDGAWSTEHGDMLSEDQIKMMSSKQFDEWEKALKARRQLSDTEIRIVRKQRRTVKNREYSQKSRARKQHAMDTLKDQVADLQMENSGLRNTNNELMSENVSLREKIVQLVSAFRMTRGTEPLLPHPCGLQGKTANARKRKAASISSVSKHVNNNARSGVCLLVLFLSIGIFVRSEAPTSASVPRLSLFPSSSSQRSVSLDVTASTGRVMLSTSDSTAESFFSTLLLFTKSLQLFHSEGWQTERMYSRYLHVRLADEL